MSFPPDMMPSSDDGCIFLSKFFRNVDQVKDLIKNTLAIIAVEPILCERATIYIGNPVFSFLWHDLLTENAYIIDEAPFGSSYLRHNDGSKIRVERYSDRLRLTFFSTHEICLITPKDTYMPFNSLSSAKETIISGPMRGKWQVEELQALRDRGWKVNYYAGGEILDQASNLKMEGELNLDTGRCLLDKHTFVAKNDHSEDNMLITENTEIRAQDAVGIEVALMGFS